MITPFKQLITRFFLSVHSFSRQYPTNGNVRLGLLITHVIEKKMNTLLFNDQTKAQNQIRSWKFDVKKGKTSHKQTLKHILGTVHMWFRVKKWMSSNKIFPFYLLASVIVNLFESTYTAFDLLAALESWSWLKKGPPPFCIFSRFEQKKNVLNSHKSSLKICDILVKCH